MQSARPSGSLPSPRAPGRGARSREGCITCKRRKVKCDEQRPCCSHCERLNMECKWRPPTGSAYGDAESRRAKTAGVVSAAARPSPPLKRAMPGASDGSMDKTLSTTTTATATAIDSEVVCPPYLHAVNEVFDFANFMWDSGAVWQEVGRNVGIGVTAEPLFQQQLQQQQQNGQSGQSQEDPSEPSTVPDTGSVADVPGDNYRLMDYFMHAVIPPILAEVETQKKWMVVRRVLVGRANASRMVRWAILAFSNRILVQREGTWLASQQNHYGNAMAEVVAMLEGRGQEQEEQEEQEQEQPSASLAQPSRHRENLLATLFFLSYVDILEGHIESAHANLKRAHDVLQASKGERFSTFERQFLLWLRLLDARAVSAGGEGLFLSTADDAALLVETPPAGALGEMNEQKLQDTSDDMEDALFQILYQPGVLFFQKVQSFMGRISRIDPWHRSRGTVEDELEVMNVGAAIAADLRALYDSRPLLMDYAVAGRLTAAHVSAQLAVAVTRSFRTYLCNYYASKVHLHRVAYKTLPLTAEAADALQQIRRLARLLAESLDAEEALPVNMLWPLLMLGSEEQDGDERAWIRAKMLRMEKVAGNARVTAQVLDEVQARQDASKLRVDIRSVMHDIFDACFAIV